MRSIEKRNDRFRLIFYHAGRRYAASLKTADRREAEAAAGSAERCLMLLQQGVLELPVGADIITFVLSGGKRDEKVTPPSIRTLGELKDRYLQALGLGAVEASSLYTLKIHLRHLGETLGAHFPSRASSTPICSDTSSAGPRRRAPASVRSGP
jgi:hypothetical protein